MSVFRRPTWIVPWVVAGIGAAVLFFGGTWTRAEGIAYPRTLMLVCAALLYGFALRLRLRQWRIKDTPTTGCGGVVIGTCEVSGTAGAEPWLKGRASGAPCAWYSWQLQEYVSSGKNSHWATRQSEVTKTPFTVTDPTGTVTVWPEHAEMMAFKDRKYAVEGRSKRTWRQLERRLEIMQHAYVIGPVTFGADNESLAFRCDDAGDEFIITDATERQVSRRLSIAATAATLLGIVAAVLAFVLYAHQGVDSKGKPTVYYGSTAPVGRLRGVIVLVVVVYVVALFVGWLVRAYNRLATVRAQAEKAWSTIAVEVQRRHDLIGQLTAIVRAYANYERRTLEQLTSDRTLPDAQRLHATAVVDESTQLERQDLVALAEQYPQLHADDQFDHLADELTRTENRVAVARTFYNDAITVLRDRRGTFPYVLVARFVNCPTFELYRADAGDRPVAPVALG